MNHVFISYARADREIAHQLADELTARGLSVWWDHNLAPGQTYANVIAQELATTKCVLVLWSKQSVASGWVGDEASEGQRRQILVPAVIEAGVEPRIGFRSLQTADLSGWVPGTSNLELEKLCSAIFALTELEPAPAPPPSPPQPPQPPPPPPPPVPSALKRNLTIAGAVLLGVALYQTWVDEGLSNGPETRPMPLQSQVQWQDYVLNYSGAVNWDGSSDTASLSASIVDRPSGRPLGQRTVVAQVRHNGAEFVEIGAFLDVPGDSQGNYPHSHNVNLQFRNSDSGWVFVRNCMRGPDRPEQCW